MVKKICMIGGAILFGAMFVVGLVILQAVPNRFAPPFPDRAVVGGSLAMFATVGGFALAFVEAATSEK
jgi:hypothetical protein